MSLQVVARISVRPDKLADAKEVLLGVIPPTRQEKGCIKYELVQNAADPTDWAFIEEWESDAALDAHLKTPHIAAAFEKIPLLLQGPPDIRRYTKLG